MKWGYVIIILLLALIIVSCQPKALPAPAPLIPPSQPVPEESTATSAPPSQDTSPIIGEEAIFFHDDFEDGNADGWELGTGWDIAREGDNYVLAGCERTFARPNIRGWSDYVVETKFKLVNAHGSFYFNLSLREDLQAAYTRYFLGIFTQEIQLGKQTATGIIYPSQKMVTIRLDKWYAVKAILKGNNIKVYLDDELVINYSDNENPILSGSFSFETMGTTVYFDDIDARTVQAEYLVRPPEPTKPTPTPTAPVATIPAYAPPPPRPYTPFVVKEEGVLFQDDFEDGMADGWNLNPDWNITSESGNYFLTGRAHSSARPDVTGWSDYTIEAKFKLVKGEFNLNLREAFHGIQTRYIVRIHTASLNLKKQISSDSFELMQNNVLLESNKWYTIKADVKGSDIRIYLDGSLVLSYTDHDIPIFSGIFSFETVGESIACFDDILVNGTQLVQRNKWVKTGGPLGGLGYDVRIHPLDKSIMFVTDDPSGVNKSYNGGNTWVQRNKGITARTGVSWDRIPVFCLTIDPNNPDIVWAGTQNMRGVYKSTDGGETWMKKDNGIREWGITFRNFGIRPGNSNIVFAGTQIEVGGSKSKGKIYKTEDGGENWRCVWEGDSLVRFVLFDPASPDTMYASTGIFDVDAYNDIGVGILKSINGGETWQQVNNGLKNLYLGFLEMHPENPRTLFAAAGSSSHPVNSGVYKTADGGESWAQVLHSEQPITVVTVSPSDPDVVYAGGPEAFYRSGDGGKNWQKFWKEKEHCYGPPGVRAGFPISAVVDPDDPDIVFVNNYQGGVFKSTDGARTWVDCSTGYTGVDMGYVALSPHNPDLVYAIGRSGPFRSLDGGREWQGLSYAPAAFPEWGNVALNPENPQEVLISDAWFGALLRSSDYGNTWEMVFQHPVASQGDPNNQHGFSAIAYAPSDPETIYAGMQNATTGLQSSFGIYKSVDSGQTWQEKNHGLENSSKNIYTIVVHPRNPDIAYAGTSDGIFKTADGGENWVAINNGLLSLRATSLAIDPQNPDTVYAGLHEGVGIFKTTNGGELWEPINFGITVECPSFLQRVGQVQPGVSLEKPKRVAEGGYYSIPWTVISSVVIDSVDPQILYCSDFHLGVYMSIDGGESWTPINDGLSMKAVPNLVLSADGHILYAATQGGGVFRLELW